MSDPDQNHLPAEAMRHAAANDLPAALAVLEADADPAVVARRYADFAQALYNQQKDVTKMLAAAQAGIRYCTDTADRLNATDTEAARALKASAKIIAFNAAANCWPGWGDEGVRIDDGHLQEAGDLAAISRALVDELDLGPQQTGNAHWLVGAIHLASGRHGDAIASFGQARDAFSDADNSASALMAAGYAELTRKRADGPDWSPVAYEEILDRLRQEGSPDGPAFAGQIVTADRLL